MLKDKKKVKQSKETKQASESDPGMTDLGVTSQKFLNNYDEHIKGYNKKKVDNMQEQTGSISMEMETLRMIQ